MYVEMNAELATASCTQYSTVNSRVPKRRKSIFKRLASGATEAEQEQSLLPRGLSSSHDIGPPSTVHVLNFAMIRMRAADPPADIRNALKEMNYAWMDETFVGGRYAKPNTEGHFELKEDLRILYTQNQEVPPYGERD